MESAFSAAQWLTFVKSGLNLPLSPFHEGSSFALLIYVRDGGASPATEFLEGLQRRDRVRVTALLERVAEHGPLSSGEKSAPLTGENFFEFKAGQQRLFWCYAPDRRIILLSGFTKKGSRTPKNELATGRTLCEEVREEISNEDRRSRG
ncbi:MAG: type II toxin-antitoxin system RelE/ParE family toxin [Chloroflexi bacterium]|nr:type II toxin-antitoxin system RelE/ParE family toxin [Chloroflexota bacterium]